MSTAATLLKRCATPTRGILPAALGSLLVFAFTASAASVTSPGQITMPEIQPASPYPSTIDVSGLAGTVTKVTVTLNGFTHSASSHADVMVVGPGGQRALIMSDVGNSAVSGLTITLDDAAGSALPDGAPLTSGTFQPTNHGTTYDAFAPPAPNPTPFPSAASALSVFNGANPNGSWSLYVGDDGPGLTGSVSGGWTVTITTSGSPTAFSNTSAITISDYSPGNHAATPYPSTISVSGVGTINAGSLTLTLNNLSASFPDDIDVLLVGPGTQKALVMSDVGGGSDPNSVTLTLDDAAAAPLPDTTGLSTGTFRPTNIDTASDTFPAGAPAGPYGSALSTFDGTSPNGTWSLYVADDLSADGGYFAGGWSLNFAPGGVPTAVEVASLSAAARADGVLLSWRTAHERRLAGFHVYRGKKQLNRALIPARHAGQARAGSYRLLDRGAKAGASHVYRLEVVRLNGTRTVARATAVRAIR